MARHASHYAPTVLTHPITGGNPHRSLLTHKWQVNLYGLDWRLYIHDKDGAGIQSPTREPLQRHTLYLIPPHTRMTTYCDQPVTQLHMHFRLHDPCPRIQPGLYICDQNSQVTQAGIEFLYQKEFTPHWQHIQALHLITGCLPQLPAAAHVTDDSDPRVNATIDFVSNHLNESLDIAAYARMHHITRTAFIRIFREVTGTSPLQYFLAMKIDVARRRIENGDTDLAALAKDLGFVDQSHFSRTFKAMLGDTPGHFRDREQLRLG